MKSKPRGRLVCYFKSNPVVFGEEDSGDVGCSDVTEDCYCYGCHEFVCSEHSRNLLVPCNHDAADHWSYEE